MLKISVGLGKKLYKDYTRYCRGKMENRQKLSDLSARNHLLELKVSGTTEAFCRGIMTDLIKTMGYTAEDTYSSRTGVAAEYDPDCQSFTEYIVVPRNFDTTAENDRESLLETARYYAKDIRSFYRKLV